MLTWIAENEPVIGIALQALTAAVWLVYLQLLVMGYLRQRRPNILIHRSVGIDDGARCFVSNMGAEPIYLISMMAEMTIDGEAQRIFVTDRDELQREDSDWPTQWTAQGPIKSGAMVDIGSFGDIVWRGLKQIEKHGDGANVSDLMLTALCSSGHSERLVGARREFRIGSKDGNRSFVPVQAISIQIDSRLESRRLRRLLEKDLKKEAMVYVN